VDDSLVRAAITVPAKADIIAPVEVRPPKCKTCNAKLRIGSEADRRANPSKTFSEAAVIDGRRWWRMGRSQWRRGQGPPIKANA